MRAVVSYLEAQSATRLTTKQIRNNGKSSYRLQEEDTHLRIAHLLQLVHGLVIVDALDGLVDDAMAHRQHRLIGIGRAQIGKEVDGTALQMLQRLDVVGPGLVLQVGNELVGETSPVALTQQRRRVDLRIAMRLGNDPAGVDGTFQIARHKGVDLLILQPVAYLTGLLTTCLIQLTLFLTLQDLGLVVHRLAVAH